MEDNQLACRPSELCPAACVPTGGSRSSDTMVLSHSTTPPLASMMLLLCMRTPGLRALQPTGRRQGQRKLVSDGLSSCISPPSAWLPDLVDRTHEVKTHLLCSGVLVLGESEHDDSDGLCLTHPTTHTRAPQSSARQVPRSLDALVLPFAWRCAMSEVVDLPGLVGAVS